MSVIVTDTGFQAEDFTGSIVALSDYNGETAVDLSSACDPQLLADHLNALEFVRVDFPSFADGRGFTIGRQLRLMGYTGRLRAKGHVISDQYAMARRQGFDEVEISAEQAERQPEGEWTFRANWQQNDYQNRVRVG
ncbi:MAG: DUF934 domain-containing protein [Thalassovita sp.]